MVFLASKKTQIIFLIYSQMFNIIATPEVEKRCKERERSGQKRSASTTENEHQPKKV